MWIILSCHAAMAIGTLLGAWRIVKTMGSRITPHLRPIGGFSAEFAAATTIGLATLASVPISTTHAIGGAVSGVGATRGWHAVRWIWGQRIVFAWILTFPGAALIGAVGLPNRFSAFSVLTGCFSCHKNACGLCVNAFQSPAD
jgi:PiT family inorganic phosphate transporter